MSTRGIAASFWRGGTSRGLILRAETMAPYPPSVRSDIIRTALGSPDPDGRQISGLGGGVSSLSKAMIVGIPGEGEEAQAVWGKLPGVEWADEGTNAGLGEWDIVYRFAQVGVRDDVLDWSSTCGNMLSAVALQSIALPILPYTTLFTRARSLPRPEPGQPLLFPLSILSASNGAIMRARVPIDPITLQVWQPPEGEGVKIAGVPGEEVGIEVEMPMAEDVELFEPASTIAYEEHEIPYSLLSSGLPNIVIPISSLSHLDIPTSLLTSSASELTSHSTLSTHLERLRQSIASALSLPFSLSTPKVCLIGPAPSEGYRTSSGTRVEQQDADFVARTVSSGDWHATIPGTTLGALNIGAGTKGSVVWKLMNGEEVGGKEEGNAGVVQVRVGNAAGVASSSVRFERSRGKGEAEEEGELRPVSVVMMRTAREIMRGEVMVPERVFAKGEEDEEGR
ncbi:hypothetical protein BCR35DRAFT_286005 [Leucosporidium creatinivorum]|uniref:PrpF protein-domain-containing protein n=1 Tax=Leucosporidium creatinivorum TaxID=106004 RepID=A0A1Y2G3Z9_9BASI|nr:hypothetical protein BCR35DRAFT_286005 [Leucosporidium creatinivorum]